MFLLDEKNEDTILRYEVIFPNRTREIITSKLDELMKLYYRNKEDLTPFTMAFLWNNAPLNWGLAKNYSNEEIYVRDLTKKIDTDDLYYMFRKTNEIGKLDELIDYLNSDINARELFFTNNYPDIAQFSTVFPYAEFKLDERDHYFPNELSVLFALNHKYNYCRDESDEEVLDWIIETAKNNTDVIRRLKLKPNIIK